MMYMPSLLFSQRLHLYFTGKTLISLKCMHNFCFKQHLRSIKRMHATGMDLLPVQDALSCSMQLDGILHLYTVTFGFTHSVQQVIWGSLDMKCYRRCATRIGSAQGISISRLCQKGKRGYSPNSGDLLV